MRQLSSGISSGWLKAPSLGLAIPGPEFVAGLHLWLGVSLFPFPPFVYMPFLYRLLW